MNYTLHQLLILAKVAECQSITRAAEALHLSQPAVSVQLKNLQEQFKIPLFHIRAKRVFMTDFGNELVQTTLEIAAQLESFNYRAKGASGKLSGKLSISIVSTGKYIMPYFLQSFLAQNPEVELRMDVTNKAGVISALDHSDAELALVSALPRQLKIAELPLLQNHLFWVVGPQFQIEKASYSPEILKTMPLIFREAGSATRAVMEQVCDRKKVGGTKELVLTTNEAIKQAIMAGLGCSVMPLIGLKHELASGDLQLLPVKGLPVVTQWRLIWLSTRPLSPVAAAYLAHLQNNREQVYEEHFAWTSAYLHPVKL
ncbi:MAG: LysR family transcriptional regulator [Sphingobacteriaceae bacterium]|nr:LysR family transcriptional regulator [Sphingobacteriaceae bacterium]